MEFGALCIDLARLLARQVIANEGGRQSLVGDHAVLDHMAQIYHAGAIAWGSAVGLGRPLMPLIDNSLVEDADLADHEKPQVLDDIGRQRIVRYVVVLDIETEILPLEAAAIGKINLEVETNPLIH